MKNVLISFCLLLSVQPAFAESLLPPAIAVEKTKSIYEYNPWRDGVITAAGFGFTIWAYTDGEKLIHPRCPCDSGELNGWDRGVVGNESPLADRVSDATLAVTFAIPAALDYWEVGASKEFLEDMGIYFEALSINGGLVTATKYATQRPLPRTYEGDPSLISSPGGYRSFYSGHASNAFLALSVASMNLKLRHPQIGVWPWIVTGVVGTSVALEKVAGGRHFWTDVVVGAAIGTSIGVMVPYLHRRTGQDFHVGLMPFEDGAVARMSLHF